jgi:hypothetical protein
MKSLFLVIFFCIFASSCVHYNHLQFVKDTMEVPDSVFVFINKYNIELDSSSKYMRDWIVSDSNYKVIDFIKVYKKLFFLDGIDDYMIFKGNDIINNTESYAIWVTKIVNIESEGSNLKKGLFLRFTWLYDKKSKKWKLKSCAPQTG